MDKLSKIIPFKSDKKSKLINYYNNSKISNNLSSTNSNNNISEITSNNKNIKPYNENFSLFYERRRKMERIINQRNRIIFQNKKLNDAKSSISTINKSVHEHLKKNSSILNISANFEENKSVLVTPKIRIPKKIKLRNSILDLKNFNNKNSIYNNIFKPRLDLSSLSFLDLGRNLLERNKYFSDCIKNKINKTINEEIKMKEKKDWENVESNNEKKFRKKSIDVKMEDKDIKIEQLAKDLNLFQNDKHFENINLKNNYSYGNLLNNLKYPEENNSFIGDINKKNNINERLSPISSGSTSIPSSRNYSGKVVNNLNNVNINKFNFDKDRLHNILNKRNSLNELPQEYEYNIEGTNILSPFCEKARDLFLYQKIFYYYNRKKLPKLMSKFINNKLNICYADNEEKFNEIISKENLIKKEKGKGKIMKIGKTEEEKRAESVNHKINFIKRVIDYAYPDVLVYRIKHKSKENKLIKIKRQKKIDEKFNFNKKFTVSKKNALLSSIQIEKI